MVDNEIGTYDTLASGEGQAENRRVSANATSNARQIAQDIDDDDAESAPFIARRNNEDEDDDDDDEDLQDPLADSSETVIAADEKEESRSIWFLFILSLSIGGLQICWTTELGNGSPFLLSLGLNKSLLSFVWIAGPLMGVLVQPYVGILSDQSRSKWGKRRPFMVAGAVATSVSFLALAWSREIISTILGLFGASPDSQGVKITIIIWAVLWVYVLDFAINAVQAAIRAFIVDCTPTHQQEDANAWAGRLTGFGSILGYLSGYIELPRYFSFFGNTQFKILSMFASLSLSFTVAVSCFYIKERDAQLEEAPQARERLGVLSFLRQTYVSMTRLPPRVRQVCEVQFFNWMGWFPFLFYITTYIGQLYVNPIFEENPDLPDGEIDKQWEMATRIGSFALFVESLVAFGASIFIPLLVVPSSRALSPAMSSETGRSFDARLQRILQRLIVPRLTLRRVWLVSHIFFFICMMGTFFATTPAAGTVIVTLLGLSWAVSMWAPFALISSEISKRDMLKRARHRRRQRPQITSPGPSFLGESPAATPLPKYHEQEDLPSPRDEDQAGVVLGLHNVSISAPQILATLLSSGVFKLLQRDRGTAGDDSVGWVLRFGGIAALVAAFMTWRMKEESDDESQGHQRHGSDFLRGDV